MARVMTTSSGFLVVLCSCQPRHPGVVCKEAYMADSPLVEGEICATMDLRRSVILAVGYSMKEV